MAQPKVSIIVPIYNAEEYLERSIGSLRAQSLQEIEIILVDDSSTDGSLAFCRKAAEEDPRIKVLHKPNEGAGMARNAALAVAEGEYIGFLDADDYVEREMFATLYEKAEQTKSDLVLSGVIFEDGTMFSRDGNRDVKRYFETDTLMEGEALTELRMGIIGAKPSEPDDSKYSMSIWKNLFRHAVIRENHLTFQSDLCKGCALCITVCPKHILALDESTNVKGYRPAVCTDEAACVGCASCARICPDSILTIEKD